VTRSNFYAEDSQILGATVHNLVVRTIWRLEFVYPCFKHLAELPGRGIGPSQSLHVRRKTQKNIRNMPQWFLWSSKPPALCWSGRRRYTPYTAQTLWSAVEHSGADCTYRCVAHMYLKDIGCEGVDWIDLAEDRDTWRALGNTTMNLLD